MVYVFKWDGKVLNFSLESEVMTWFISSSLLHTFFPKSVERDIKDGVGMVTTTYNLYMSIYEQ